MVVGHHRTPYVNIDPFPSPHLTVLSRAPISHWFHYPHTY